MRVETRRRLVFAVVRAVAWSNPVPATALGVLVVVVGGLLPVAVTVATGQVGAAAALPLRTSVTASRARR